MASPSRTGATKRAGASDPVTKFMNEHVRPYFARSMGDADEASEFRPELRRMARVPSYKRMMSEAPKDALALFRQQIEMNL